MATCKICRACFFSFLDLQAGAHNEAEVRSKISRKASKSHEKQSGRGVKLNIGDEIRARQDREILAHHKIGCRRSLRNSSIRKTTAFFFIPD